MRTTMDRSGRLVIPKELRDRIGLRPGEVELHVDGAGLHVEPVAGEPLVRRDGRLIVQADEAVLTDDDVRALRDADRR